MAHYQYEIPVHVSGNQLAAETTIEKAAGIVGSPLPLIHDFSLKVPQLQ